jgi:hypothetical protein
MAVGSDGTVHVAWYDYTDYGGAGTDWDIFYKKFVPGSGWAVTEVVSTESTSSSYRPSLAIGSDGKVHIAWEDWTDYGGSGTDRDIFYKRWVAGKGWSGAQVVSTESTGLSRYPSLDVGSDGTVHIAWTDNSTYGSSGYDFNIIYKQRTSTNGWTPAEVVSTKSTSVSSYPSLAVGSDGSPHSMV